MSKRFIHLIPNCNHAVSLAYFLSNIKATEEHEILIDQFNCHSKDYFLETKKIFTNTSHLKERLNLSNESIVVFHGLFSKTVLSLLPQLINSPINTVWSIWGGDIRLLKERKNIELLNKLDFVLCAPGETLPYTNFSVPELHTCLYLPPNQSISNIEKEDLIVLGNSGDTSNNHAYLLKIAQKFESSKIHIPFAYNGSKSYLKTLLSLSKDIGIFERVHFQTEIMSLTDYTNLFSRAKVFLTAHNRQQALGSLQIAYKTNCAVYLKKIIRFDNNKTMVNPAYLTLQMLGYPDIKDIACLENPKVGIDFPFEKENTVNEINIRNPKYIERIFEVIKCNVCR
jgi:hypothetical protein